MIATILLAASLARPFVVEWEVRWAPPLKAEKHIRRYAVALDAVTFAAGAPMCANQPAPCVEWVKVYVDIPPDPDPNAKGAKR